MSRKISDHFPSPSLRYPTMAVKNKKLRQGNRSKGRHRDPCSSTAAEEPGKVISYVMLTDEQELAKSLLEDVSQRRESQCDPG